MNFAADEPVVGFYRVRMVRNGPWVPVRIWRGPPIDPDTGEELDRSWRYFAERDGKLVEVDRVWPWCGRHPISEQEFQFLRQRSEHARHFRPDDPHANPRQSIDLLSAPIPTF